MFLSLDVSAGNYLSRDKRFFNPCTTSISGTEPGVNNFGRFLCDTVTPPGDWLTIMRRENGRLSFHRKWADYKYGFGQASDNFWTGNYNVFLLTSKARYELRVDMRYGGRWYYARYSWFKINPESDDFRLFLGPYVEGNAGDSFSYHNRSVFSTYDRDNNMDLYDIDCLEYARAPWWFKVCQECLLFGNWKSKEMGKGINWETLTGYRDSLDFVEMKIRPV